MTIFSNFLNGCDTALQLILLVLLIRAGALRKYTSFSLYIAGSVAADILQRVAERQFGWRSASYRQLFWTDQIALDVLLFLVIIALTYQALGSSPQRAKAGKALGAIGLAVLALPFALLPSHSSATHGSFTSQWFNHASQILNFGAAIMTLVLWMALLLNRRGRDQRLVTLSIGLGLATTSAAVLWGVRRWITAENRELVDSFRMLVHLAALLIWCWAFRTKGPSTGGETLPSGASPTKAPPSELATAP